MNGLLNLFSQAVVICCAVVVLSMSAASISFAQDLSGGAAIRDEIAFRKEMAKAVRTTARHVLDSVVGIEVVGAIESGKSEVASDAPTSGVIVSEQGHILASSIVVRRPSATILVVLPDGSRHAATVIAQDHHRDLVLLKIKPPAPLQPIVMLDRFDTPIGATTVAVGRYGSDQSPMISTGVLSAIDRLEGIAIQTDARVPPAMYGGPLMDLRGNVLGVLIPAVGQGVAEDVTSWYDSGIAFAIATDVIAGKIDRMKNGDDINKGLIGIVAASRDLTDANTKVAAVRVRSPAEKAGMKGGDQITSVDGQPVERFQQIRQILGRFDAGETLSVELQRDGQTKSIEVTLVEEIPPLTPQRLGVVVSERTSQSDQDDKTTSLVVDVVVPGTSAAGKLKAGDVLLKLGDVELDSITTFRRQLMVAQPDRRVTVDVIREEQPQQIQLALQDIAGAPIGDLPESWYEQTKAADPWQMSEIQLPESPNKAAFVGPAEGAARNSGERNSGERLGLMMLILESGKRDPADAIEAWKRSAQVAGVVVCAIASENPSRWQAKELEVVANLAKAIMKKAPIDPAAVAVATTGSQSGNAVSSADTLAMAVGVSQGEVFGGVAIHPETRAPAMRLRANDPSSSLQIFMPLAGDDEPPAWSAAFQRAGYPIIRAGKTLRGDVLNWVRLLQSI